MKIITLAVFLGITCLLGCEEEKVDVMTATPGTMIMNVDGVPFSAWFADSPEYSAIAHNYVERMDIIANFQRKWNGAVVEESQLIISMDVLAEGQFKLRGKCTSEMEPGSVFYMTESDRYSSWEVDRFFAGTVTITKMDLKNKLISGTFYLSLKGTFDQKVLRTDGSFTDVPIF